MRSLLALVVFALSCSPITPFRADGGVDAGAAGGAAGGSAGGAGGGNSAGGSSAGGSSGGGLSGVGGGEVGGGSAGGAAGGAAGGSVDGGLFQWQPVSYPGTVAVRTMHGKGSDVFATTFTGELLASSTPTTFAAIPGFAHGDADDVYVSPSLKVYVTSNRNWSYVCTSGDCRQGSNYVAAPNQNSTDDFFHLCGVGERVFAVGASTSYPAILFEYTNAFVRRSTSLGVGTARNCVTLTPDVVRVGGSAGVAVYDGGVQVETSPMSTIDWRFFAMGSDTSGLLVGVDTGGAGQVASFDGTSWRVLSGVPSVRQFDGVVALSPTEFFVVATLVPGQPMGAFLYDGSWRRVTIPSTVHTITAAHAPTSQQLYLLGAEGSGRHYVFLGTR